MITLKFSPTLLDAWDWWRSAPESWKTKAFDDLKGKLERKPFVASPAIEKGLAFEEKIQAVCTAALPEQKPKDISDYEKEVADACMQGLWQRWSRARFEIPDYGVVEAYGKLDVHWPIGSDRFPNGKVIDLKTTANYRGSQKYENGWQHVCYCSWMQIPAFEYIVVEWAADGNIANVHRIPIQVDLSTAHKKLEDHLRGFYAFLKTYGLWDTYVYTYSKNKR